MARIAAIAWASVTIEVVAVVAELVAQVAAFNIRSDDTIPAFGGSACIGTAVGVERVCVVTVFKAGYAWIENVVSNEAISAGREITCVRAAVEGIGVSIITSFSGGGNSIAAACDGAVAIATAAICVGSVVAALEAFDNAVAAGRKVRVAAISRAGKSRTRSTWVAEFTSIDDTIAAAG